MAAVLAAADRDDLIPDDELETTIGRLDNLASDKDRLCVIKSLARNFTFDCAQVARIHIGRLQGAAVRDGF